LRLVWHSATLLLPPLAVVAVAVSFALVPLLMGVGIPWSWVGIGALGWLVALVLRAPVAIGVRNLSLSPAATQTVVTSASGPAEEVVRVVILLLAAVDFRTAFAIGLGWSVIEAIYAAPQEIIRESLRHRTDEKSREARQLLTDMGLGRSVRPIWLIVERVFATAFHIGLTLLVGWQPVLAVAAIPLHSVTNLVVLATLRRSVPRAQFILALVGIAAFTAGLIVWN